MQEEPEPADPKVPIDTARRIRASRSQGTVAQAAAQTATGASPAALDPP